MASHRLETQYLKLLHHYGNEPVATTLDEIGALLCCTRRHVRSLMSQMQQEGWISWEAEIGRGKRSQLQLLREEQQFLRDKAEQLFDAGRYQDAITLLQHEKQLIAPLLQAKLGYSIREHTQILRVPYYRTMPKLHPALPLRRSELHLVRQIFSGLTRINEEKGEVEPDLAHHWRQVDALHWYFFLRPAAQWHDGKSLSVNDVIATLHRCQKRPLFAHIHRAIARSPFCIEIVLTEEDSQLPLLLSHIEALITPASESGLDEVATHPCGTGPYMVAENNDWHLNLKAFDHYYGYRALLDEVEIIMWSQMTESIAALVADEKPAIEQPSNGQSAWLSSSLSDVDYAAGLASSLSGKPSDTVQEMFLEQGGYFLLCDSRSTYWNTDAKRRWLREILNPHALLPLLSASIRNLWVPTGSLLPKWFHCIAPGEVNIPFIQQAHEASILRLAIHDHHPEFSMLTQLIQQLLDPYRVKLDVVTLSYEDWSQGLGEADLWLGTVNFAVPEAWNVGCWLLGNGLLRQSITGGDEAVLDDWLHHWHQQTITAEWIMRQVTQSGWLQPLFHHWMRLKGPEQAKGIRLNNLGWFDFQSTWFEPRFS